ncbi:unnamed protein product [Parnassius apollo]|uniref:(apollo) hypothetical protein n=1 Tax=Parnassius apollo TaxID=110799 RepID=A0A8S3X3J5_PARAO|nr:unnamed protein product [Parnassius apollo]
MANFNKEKDELLIETVKCYIAIYNKGDKEHKNNVYKHQCWEKICEVVGLPVSECKKRWKSLRDQYNKKTKEGGTGSARINSTWEYMDLMSFLSDAPERRVSRSEGISENDSQTSIRNTEVNTGIDFECDDTCTQEIYAENRPTTQENIGNTDNSTLGPSTSKKRKPIKLQEKLDKREIQRLNLLEALVNNTKNQSQVQPQSAIKKFFESMAEVVETFPPREQAAIRAKVCQLVSDTEIRLSSPVTPMPEDSWSNEYFNM